ncbi:MFS transporter [Streptosporangium sp. NBC_01639]|uniref:MFS transporter n=1 Tax=Streptosporangium sp. NBC_01639 TaxID=2975948 RepID=UPI00386C069F|nr:MFS transporter [Streptosporangium sp. NBC_01639]
MTALPGTEQAGPPTASSSRRRVGLAVLAISTFVVVTTELLPVGLLPSISEDLGVTQSRAGLLVTVYAFTVGLTAAPLTAWTSRWPRKRLFIGVCAVFALGTVLSGLAVDYPTLLLARFLCGTAHGVFWSIIAGYAAALAGPGRIGRATSIVFAGNSAALVLGVPLGATLGAAAGWRTAFWVMALLALVTVAAALRALPHIPGGAALRSADMPKVLRLPRLGPVVAATALLILGHFSLYTYITPLLHQAGTADAAVGALLSIYGLAGLAGTWFSGTLVDRRPRLVVFGAAASMAVALAALGLGAHLPPIATTAIALWGFALASLPVSLQTAVLRLGAAAPDAASSWYVAAFNLGIGGGALFGGLLLATAGVTVLPWTALTVVGLAGAVMWGARPAFSPHSRPSDPAT